MDYSDDWNLPSIPDKAFYSELGRRNVVKRKTFGGGRPITCNLGRNGKPCGKCVKCKRRKEKQQYRKTLKTKQI